MLTTTAASKSAQRPASRATRMPGTSTTASNTTGATATREMVIAMKTMAPRVRPSASSFRLTKPRVSSNPNIRLTAVTRLPTPPDAL